MQRFETSICIPSSYLKLNCTVKTSLTVEKSITVDTNGHRVLAVDVTTGNGKIQKIIKNNNKTHATTKQRKTNASVL